MESIAWSIRLEATTNACLTRRNRETVDEQSYVLTNRSSAGGGAGLRPAHGARGDHEYKHHMIDWCLYS